MADEKGFEVAEAYVTLTLADEDFAAQVTEAIETAVDDGATAAGETLVETLGNAGEEAAEAIADPLVDALGAAAEEVGDAFEEAFAELAEEADASGAMAEEAIDGVTETATGAAAEIEALSEQISALLAQNTEAADAQAQALMADLKELGGEFELTAEQMFGSSTEGWGRAVAEQADEATDAVAELDAELEGTLAAIDQAVGAIEGLQASITDSFREVEAGALTAEEAIDRVAAAMEAANTVTVAQASAMKAAMQLGPAGSLDELKSIAVLYADAAAAADLYGTGEAQLSLTTQLLTNAQANLADQNTLLMQSFMTLANSGADVDAAAYATLQAQAESLQAAQDGVTAAAQAQIDAITQVNLAVIQNETAFMDDEMALRSFAFTSSLTGIEVEALTTELEAGNYQIIAKAAADAKATLSAQQLAEAEQQLAAANLTLIETYARLAAGDEVSAEAQSAALAGVKSAQGDVTALGGGMGQLASKTESASKEFGGMGSMMMGPWGMAAYGAMMILPELGDVFSSTAVSAADFTSAVTQDSNAVGDNTASTIQATLAKSNLSDISKTLGLSQSELIEYAAGEASVQAQVAAAYDKTTAAMAQQAKGTAQGGPESGREAGYDLNKLQEQKATLDAVTTAVQQAVQEDAANSAALLAAEQSTAIYNASVNALGESQLLQVQQTKMSNQATVEYGDRLLAAVSTTQYMAAAVGAAGVNMQLQAHATDVTNLATYEYAGTVMALERQTGMFNDALNAADASMREQAQSSAISSVGLLNLGDAQGRLTQSLVSSESAYAEAQQGASAYNTAVMSLSGSFNTLYGDEASFTGALASLTSSLGTNGKSLDANSAKGYQNAEAAQAAANAAIQAATATYQNASQTQTATQAWSTANSYLEQEKEAFEQAAIKAGANKTAVDALANSLFKLPAAKDIAITADTSQATSAVHSLLQQIDDSYATVQVDLGGSASGHVLSPLPAHAAGGIAQAGRAAIFGEEGPEIGIPTRDMQIIPAAQTAQILNGATGKAPTFIFQGTQYPTGEQMAILKREFASAVGAV